MRSVVHIIMRNTIGLVPEGSQSIPAFIGSVGGGMLFLLLFLSACSVLDEREVCCEEGGIYIRYIRNIAVGDRYRIYIKSSEHFLFDKQGVLVSHSVPTGKPEELYFVPKLPDGAYTLLVVGNRSTSTRLKYTLGITKLSEMLMSIGTEHTSNYFSNGDRLYWGILPFEMKQGKPNRHFCDMSNIHCRMRVTVKWKNNLPRFKGQYTLQLRRVSESYRMRLHPQVPKITLNAFPKPEWPPFVSTKEQVVHSFPWIIQEKTVTHRLYRPMSSAKLDGKFVTMRYDDNLIPSFCVFSGGTPLMKEIDLTRFFREVKWIPSKIPEQVFHLLIEIDPTNDSVIVSAAGDMNVVDWQDGGTIGVGK